MAVLIVYLLIAAILQRNVFLLGMEILPVLLIMFIKVKISKSIKTETEHLLVICFRGDMTLPLSKNGFVQGEYRGCMEYLRRRG